MSQLTFAEAEYAIKKRKTRRELVLEKLEVLLPWKQLEAPIALETPDLVITFKQGRALQRLDKDIEHLIPLERFAVVRLGAVQLLVQQPQALGHLLPVLAGEGPEKLGSVIREEHRRRLVTY